MLLLPKSKAASLAADAQWKKEGGQQGQQRK
jgi:hypothetical protein